VGKCQGQIKGQGYGAQGAAYTVIRSIGHVVVDIAKGAARAVSAEATEGPDGTQDHQRPWGRHRQADSPTHLGTFGWSATVRRYTNSRNGVRHLRSAAL
jgi:hypothetical protein